MCIPHQYQPPQMHPIIAKFDHLLDMMESRIDAADRRVDNLRRRQYPTPHRSGRPRNIPDAYFSRHLDDAANRCIRDPRAPPLPEPPPLLTPAPPYAQRTHRNYLAHSQPPYPPDRYRGGKIHRAGTGEPPYWLHDFTANDGDQHRRARQPWREPPSLLFSDGQDPPQIPNGRYRGHFHDQPQPRIIDNNWDQGGWDDRGNNRQSQSSEHYPWRHQQPQNGRAEQLHQPSCWDPPDYHRQGTFHAGYQQWQPTYHPPEVLYTQPTYQPLRCNRSLDNRTEPLPTVAPPRSGSTHRPQQSSKFIDSGKQHGLPNIPSLKVRSPCPAQPAAVSDYNEKLRIYRLEQAALLARLNCVFEENIDDENLVEDVSNNPAHNGGANLDVPNDESLEKIVDVKTDNMPLQVLVGVYDEKIGDFIVPTHQELEMTDVVENCLSENGGALLNFFSKDSLCVDGRKFTFDVVFDDVNSGDLLNPTQWELEIKDEVGNGSAFARLQRPGTFDPGGDKSPMLLLSTLFVASWFPP